MKNPNPLSSSQLLQPLLVWPTVAMVRSYHSQPRRYDSSSTFHSSLASDAVPSTNQTPYILRDVHRHAIIAPHWHSILPCKAMESSPMDRHTQSCSRLMWRRSSSLIVVRHLQVVAYPIRPMTIGGRRLSLSLPVDDHLHCPYHCRSRLVPKGTNILLCYYM